MEVMKMVALKKGQPFFEYPFYTADVKAGIEIAFSEFRRLNPDTSLYDEDVTFKFEKA
ncbi:hypothetical protein [Bradyrhizobium japonicum]|uniref:hypothetical protein n=1 Tax=Bradyrhizobium japonicum TaxID=375 RepID=UPI0004195891|nr:hypothetical protein [Bradyrhizobium japonicum]